MAKKGDLRVWWIRNVPNKPEYYPVNSVEDAIACLKKLAKDDLKNQSVDSNAGGLERFESNPDKLGTFDWYEFSDDNGDDIDAIMREKD